MALFHQFVAATILNFLLEKSIKPNVHHQFHQFSLFFFVVSLSSAFVLAPTSGTEKQKKIRKQKLLCLYSLSIFFNFFPSFFRYYISKINIQHHRKLQSKEVGSMPAKVMTLNWPALYMVTLLPM